MRIVFLFIFFSGLVGCDGRPLVNSKEYLELHGIVNGKEKFIEVGKTKFTIPSEINVQVETYGEIKKGKADVLRLYLDYSNLIEDWSSSSSRVRVEVRHFGDNSHTKSDGEANKKTSILTGNKTNSGLIELPVEGPAGGWSFKRFIAPLEEEDPEVGNLVLNCSGVPETGVNQCWGGYRKGTIDIWIFLSGRLLPYWRQVILRTDQEIESMIRE